MSSKKHLLLMRHAKSSWDNIGLKDFDRPLNKRGNRDAPRMGKYLKELNLIPDQIFCSPAARAKTTILHVTKELGFPETSITWSEDLYFSGVHAYMDAFQQADPNSEVVMTVGHNPMTDEAISLLANRPVYEHIATAAIACLEADIDSWNLLTSGACRVKWIVAPKDIV